METRAQAKFVRMSPRKVRLVVDLIRHMGIEEARHQLMFLKKDAAKPVLKVLESAIANATNNHKMDASALQIKEARVDEGPTLHRFTPRAQGRATAIRKRMSHITIVLTDGKDAPASPKATAKATPKSEAKEENKTAKKTPEKKSAAKKTAVKKAPAKKPAAKKTTKKTSSK